MNNDKKDLGADAAAVEGARSAEPQNTGKHTPGPWKAFCDFDTGRYAVVLDDNDPGQCVIADIEEQQQDRENAHLIAAAPELLEYAKLEAAIESFDCPHDAEHRCKCGDVISKMIDLANTLRPVVIAKAEGAVIGSGTR